jgi:hypothetical protein
MSDPTVEELLKFMNKLMRGLLLFEPVTDREFNRPLGKIQELVRQHDACIDQLKQIDSRFDSVKQALQSAQSRFESRKQVFVGLGEIGSLTHGDRWLKELVNQKSLSTEERERRRKKNARERSIRNDARILHNKTLLLDPEIRSLTIQVSTDQLQSAFVWLFLDKLTKALSVASRQVLHTRNSSEITTDLFFDVTEKLLHIELPIGTFIKILTSLYKREFGERNHETEIERDLSRVEILTFLKLYFDWWEDSHGHSQIQQVVSDWEATITNYEAIQILLISQVHQFETDLNAFQSQALDFY